MWGNPYHTYVDEPETIVETSTTSETSQEIIDEKPTASEVIAAQEAWGWNATAVNPAIDPATSETVHDQQVYQEPRQVDEDEMVSSWGWNASGPQTKINEIAIAEDALVSATDEVRELTEAEVEDMKASWGWNTCPTPSQAETPRLGLPARLGCALASMVEKIIGPNVESNIVQNPKAGKVSDLKSAWAWNSHITSLSVEAPNILPIEPIAEKLVSEAEAEFVKSNWAWNAYLLQDQNSPCDITAAGVEKSFDGVDDFEDTAKHHLPVENKQGLMPPPSPEASPASVEIANSLPELPAPLAI